MVKQPNPAFLLGPVLSPYATAAYRFRRILESIWNGLVPEFDHVKRIGDVLLSGFLLAVVSPLLLLLAVRGSLKHGAHRVFATKRRLGKAGVPFSQIVFRGLDLSALGSLPVLLNVLRGDMSLVGPRALSPEEGTFRAGVSGRRSDIRPGLVCSHWLQQRSQVDFDGESVSDLLYVDTRDLRTDFGLALRACVTALFGGRASVAARQTVLLGLTMDNYTMGDALDWLETSVGSAYPGETREVCFVNPHCANLAWHDRDYRQIINTSHLRLPDGIGIVLGGKLAQSPIRQNVNGTDLFPRMCKRLEGTGCRIYLLGAGKGVAQEVAAWITSRTPGFEIAGCADGFFSEEEEPAVIERIRASGADLLLVAMGVPRQEKWIRAHAQETGIKVAMGVGGLFDFYSGRIPRAPQWMREVGMEWFYRFCQEPRRLFHRYFVGNCVFLSRILRHEVFGRPTP